MWPSPILKQTAHRRCLSAGSILSVRNLQLGFFVSKKAHKCKPHQTELFIPFSDGQKDTMSIQLTSTVQIPTKAQRRKADMNPPLIRHIGVTH